MKNLDPIFDKITKPLQPKEAMDEMFDNPVEKLDEIIDRCIDKLEQSKQNLKDWYNEMQEFLGNENRIK